MSSSESGSAAKPNHRVILRVGRYLFRYRPLFILTMALAIGSTLCWIAIPKGIQIIIDRIVLTDRSDMLPVAVAVLILFFLGRETLNCLRIRVNNTLEQKVLLDLRQDLHRKLLELPIGFYDRRKSGDVASRVIEDVSNVERALLDGTEQGSVALLTILGITTILFFENAFLAMFVVLPLPILLWIGIRHARKSRLIWRGVRDSAGLLNSLLVEDIQGNRLIQSFALGKREENRFLERSEDLRTKTLRGMFRYSTYSATTGFIASVGTLFVVGLGGWMITRGEFTTGQFIAFYGYCAMLYQPIFQLSALNQMLAAGKASGERVFEILDHPIEIADAADAQPFPAGAVTVNFENVSFSYPERAAVVTGLELSLPAGRVTALVGHTGAGKSTISNLILRYYDVSSGRVTLNGLDVRSIALQSLRENIGVVAQDPFLFDATVRENLQLARPDCTEAEIRAALAGACADDFVNRLPSGMDTLIGERGIRLSMGEKQRLTIARVLLRNPPLVILDEATSSVDTITEREIQAALDRLVEGRTVLVIAHRLSTVRRADQIVVLDQGRIIERGNHRQLIERGGHYHRLWQHQSDLLD